jgi:hypothetical protein
VTPAEGFGRANERRVEIPGSDGGKLGRCPLRHQFDVDGGAAAPELGEDHLEARAEAFAAADAHQPRHAGGKVGRLPASPLDGPQDTAARGSDKPKLSISFRSSWAQT